MRHLPAALVAATLLAPLSHGAASSDARACGFYTPRVYLVAETLHRQRSFALATRRDDLDHDDPRWERVDPVSYDDSQAYVLASETPLATPLTFVGEGTSLTVTGARAVAVRDPMITGRGAFEAYEVAPGGASFSVAVLGRHSDLDFEHVTTTTTTADLAWARAADPAFAKVDFATTVDDVEAVTFSDASSEPRTAVRRGKRFIGEFPGLPIGRLDADGVRYLILADHGAARVVPL